MIRYTVTFTRRARDALAREWLNATDRRAITRAGDEIDHQLHFNASEKGEEVREGLRRVIVTPLSAQFSVDEGDRMVTVWSIRLVKH